MSIPGSVIQSIGNTPMVPLRRIVPPGSARILAKLEWANPTGSMVYSSLSGETPILPSDENRRLRLDRFLQERFRV